MRSMCGADAGCLAINYQSLLGKANRHRAGEVSSGEKMLYSGTDPESFTTEYIVYEEKHDRHTDHTAELRVGGVALRALGAGV